MPPRGSNAVSEKRGVRTHILLVVAMAVVIMAVTSVSLLLVRHRLRAQVTDDLSRDLEHSVITFRDLQTERLGALERENALLADLPTLKALMTSSDDLTIQDGAIEFWDLSGNDLFALADSSGRIVAAYTKSPGTALLHTELQQLLITPGKRFLVDGKGLYACSVQPLYFGSEESGTLLGYVISGVSIERTVRQISQPTGVEASFLSAGEPVASTLPASSQSALTSEPRLLRATVQAPVDVQVGHTHYIAATEDLSGSATSSLRLVLMKSVEPAERSITRINRLLLIAGLVALLIGTVLMIVLSRVVVRPLEELSEGVRAFGVGDVQHRIPANGTQEVRELSQRFAAMRDEIRKASVALVESERLATIGRMASSVSHDLRHYLAAVYANAEFLASDRLSPKERAEIFADIRTAVLGTTEMIESLLIFSRTGGGIRSTSELLATLLERAVALIRTHPDAEGVEIVTRYGDPTETAVRADAKQIERAIYNLLLNACEAARIGSGPARVVASITVEGGDLLLRISDNGPGVPPSILDSLFNPFVSFGKQKGTGLGLTVTQTIVAEHGGEVVLLASAAGDTSFELRLPCEARPMENPEHHPAAARDEVAAP